MTFDMFCIYHDIYRRFQITNCHKGIVNILLRIIETFNFQSLNYLYLINSV